jgi:RNA polymerase sigma-70 factor, ECF subfamily
LMPPADRDLLAQAGQGDQSAFTTLYENNEADLYRFACYLAGTPERADDLFQDTWLKIVGHAGRQQIDDFRRWAFTIMVNLNRDRLRKQKIRRLVMTILPAPSEHDEKTSGESTAENFIVRDALMAALDRLSDKQRTIFVLTYLEGFKIREVSQMIGKAEGTVKSTLSHALTKLRVELKRLL